MGRHSGALLTRAIHGARTACAFGAQICSHRFVFGSFLLGKQKTNSPGANWDSGTLARRAKPKDGLCSGTRPRGETRIQKIAAKGGLLFDKKAPLHKDELLPKSCAHPASPEATPPAAVHERTPHRFIHKICE
jgi:hypothetical protein